VPIRIRRPGVVIRLFFLVGRDVSNLQVAWGYCVRLASATFALYQDPLDLRDANGLAALSMITTVVPAPFGRNWRWTAASCCCTCSIWTMKRGYRALQDHLRAALMEIFE
jgi:hypothetical protein